MVQKSTLRNLFKVYPIFSMHIEKQKCENLLQLAFLVFLPFRPFSCLFDHVTFRDARNVKRDVPPMHVQDVDVIGLQFFQTIIH